MLYVEHGYNIDIKQTDSAYAQRSKPKKLGHGKCRVLFHMSSY